MGFTSEIIGSSSVDSDSPLYLGNPTGISAYADQQTDAANSFLLQLAAATQNLVAPSITPEFPQGATAPAIWLPDAPEYTTPVWTSPDAPAAFTGSVNVDDILPEAFDDEPPALTFGTAPAPLDEEAPEAPAVDLTYEDPELTVELPATPNLLAINVTPFDGLNMPTLSAEEPVMDLVEPTIREYMPGEEYTSELLTALQVSLKDRIENGGTGLGQAGETAIWERGKEREAKSQREALDRLEQMESLGYAFPPGVYTDARLKIITETDYAERGHSREVMAESARLELENVKHALTTATQLEGQLMDYSNAVEQRLFESTRYATEAGVAIYNAKVQAYAALVDVYRAKIAAYEAQVRAETSRVDAYRAQIAAEEAKAQVNVALVEQYKAQAEVAMSNIRIYEARINGIRAKAEIEQAKVQVYGEQVRAYGAKINAYTAEVEGFRATLQAEETKQRVYQSAVDAYSARVGAAAKEIDARIANLSAQIDAKRIEWEGYRAEIEGESSRVRALVQNNSSLAESYRAEVQGVSSYNDTLTKQWQATLDQNQRTAEIAISAAKANAELYVTTRSLAVDAAKVGAQVSSQLGAAALNAINWSSSISSSNSWGVSTSFSNAKSSSDSDSRSTNYNYNYSV